MSVDLRSKHDQFSFSTLAWAFYLNLAELCYDWEKTGTLQPDDWSPSEGPWEGAYDWNAGQLVTEEDAINLANALEAYLADPDREEVANDFAQDFAQELGKAVGFKVEFHAGDQATVESFVQFAKQGEFRIW